LPGGKSVCREPSLAQRRASLTFSTLEYQDSFCLADGAKKKYHRSEVAAKQHMPLYVVSASVKENEEERRQGGEPRPLAEVIVHIVKVGPHWREVEVERRARVARSMDDRVGLRLLAMKRRTRLDQRDHDTSTNQSSKAARRRSLFSKIGLRLVSAGTDAEDVGVWPALLQEHNRAGA
jgi:hypothetical protein